jgi:hypothetical protein
MRGAGTQSNIELGLSQQPNKFARYVGGPTSCPTAQNYTTTCHRSSAWTSRKSTPLTPTPAQPRREPAARQPINSSGMAPLPYRPVYRRTTTPQMEPMEPIQQITALPMKTTIQTYLNHGSEEEFEKSIGELMVFWRHYQEA